MPPPNSQHVAVVLLNLGGPDSLAAVEGFLFNLFSDPDIFKLPLARFTQRPFARLIARRRAPEATHGYAAIGGASPLLANTERQARALEAALPLERFKVFVCMRYWHPLTEEVVETLKREGFSRVLLLPLYPQYSTTTTGSSFNEFTRQCRRQAYAPTLRRIERWYERPRFVQAIAAAIERARAEFGEPDPGKISLLFSAHGLPQKIVDAGDPYEREIQATYRAVCQQLGWPDTTLCYQSRVGPLKWLTPYTEDTIRQKAAAGVQQILVYPIAFVSDHIETLFELGMTYADLARSLGVREYRVVPALNDDPALIETLRELVLEHSDGV